MVPSFSMTKERGSGQSKRGSQYFQRNSAGLRKGVARSTAYVRARKSINCGSSSTVVARKTELTGDRYRQWLPKISWSSQSLQWHGKARFPASGQGGLTGRGILLRAHIANEID